VLGPIVGGFAAEANGWKWPIWELLWLCGFTVIVLIFWFPETNAETILLRRARRIRKRTGIQNIFSESEIRQAHMETSEVLFESLWRPFQLMMEPVIFYVDIYIAIGYATFYCE
jgi:DHA1 family multidrug resistance protein-like MFS transporter